MLRGVACSKKAPNQSPGEKVGVGGLWLGGSAYKPLITIWLFNIAMENPFQMEVLMGKSSISDMMGNF